MWFLFGLFCIHSGALQCVIVAAKTPHNFLVSQKFVGCEEVEGDGWKKKKEGASGFFKKKEVFFILAIVHLELCVCIDFFSFLYCPPGEVPYSILGLK